MATFSGLFSLLGNLVAAAIGPFIVSFKIESILFYFIFYSRMEIVISK